jgi:hypothetical protein
MGVRGELFSTRAASDNEKRTYFFNVKENRRGDLFLNVVESKKQEGMDYERHQIVVFEEDIEKFAGAFQKALEYVRSKR